MIMAQNRIGFILLAIAGILAFGYLMLGYGLPVGYPGSVALKASGILLLAVYAAREKAWLLAAALVFSAIGDAMLALQPSQMTLGIAAFGSAHLLYGAIFLRKWRADGMRKPWGIPMAAIILVYGVLILYWLQPGMGDLRVPATVYNAIILVMAALAALSRARVLALVGALLFVGSDSLIALDLFKDYDPAWRGPAVWISYVAAQYCLLLGLVRVKP